MNERHYGWEINTHYDWLNMLNRMEKNHPQRFREFQYSKTTIYHYLDQIQSQQHLMD